MKNLTLYLDTTKTDSVLVALKKEGKLISSLRGSSTKLKAQQTLIIIDRLLTKNRRKLSEIKDIEIAANPGSFIGLRVGFAIANTLGFLLNIRVNNQKPPALPIYN